MPRLQRIFAARVRVHGARFEVDAIQTLIQTHRPLTTMMLLRATARILIPVLSMLVSAGCDTTANTEEAEITVLDIVVGDGDEVVPGHTIIVAYVGRLEDGTVFDSSEIQGEDLIFTISVNNVIRGLDEGIPGMKVGGVREIVIPPSKAFGRTGMCTSEGDCPVPPNATVTFEITIVDILDYVIVEELIVGSGPQAEIGSLIEIEYVGVLQDNRIIASSDASGPLTFLLGTGTVIDGLDDGIVGMRLGGVRILTIPPALGYGAYGDVTRTVPPYATLRYRIELTELAGES